MSTLVLGLYAEGRTDHYFLPPVIQKTAEWILAKNEVCEVDALILPIETTKSMKKDLAYQQFVKDLTDTLKELNFIH